MPIDIIIQYAREMGNAPFAALVFLGALFWALKELIILRRQRDEAFKQWFDDAIQSAIALRPFNDADEEIIRAIKERLIGNIKKEKPKKGFIYKILSAYISGVCITFIRYVIQQESEKFWLTRKIFSIGGDTFQIDYLAEHNAYVIGIMFIPLVGVLACKMLLKLRDPTAYYVVVGGLLSVLAPYFVTAIVLAITLIRHSI